MSSIFAKPDQENVLNNNPHKVLFLHGLEGSPDGSKARHLKNSWGAVCPPLRTDLIREISSKKGSLPWSSVDRDDLEEALEPVMQDALDAIIYSKPEVIIGSSMGGAILMKLILDEKIDSEKYSKVFLAPALKELIGNFEKIPQMEESTWILGELDTIVDNKANINHCKNCRGNLIFSPKDNHRLSGALNSGLIDSAILTSIETRFARML